MQVPSMFSAGKNISLATNGRTLTFSIEKLFTPVTKSVVLRGRSTELGPDLVVIKIYDPRFLDDRFIVQPQRPWSLAAEQAAAALPPGVFDEGMLWEDEPDDAKGRAQRAALWEEHFRRLSAECFASEKSAYEHLRVLQGSAIPRLLLTGVFLPPDKRAIQLPAVVLEYIPDAVSLSDVPGGVLDVGLCNALVRAVDSFPTHGVFHNDINGNNVLFTPQRRPARGVVIDFGCAGIKVDGEDENAWQTSVHFAGDSRHIRRLLKEKGVDVQPGAPASA